MPAWHLEKLSIRNCWINVCWFRDFYKRIQATVKFIKYAWKLNKWFDWLGKNRK